jgi:hypothetical protein
MRVNLVSAELIDGFPLVILVRIRVVVVDLLFFSKIFMKAFPEDSSEGLLIVILETLRES